MPQFILDYQKSATTNSKTIVRCDKEVDHISERNSRYIDDRLSPTFLAKDKFVFSDSVLCMGKLSVRMERVNRMVYEFTPLSRIGSMEFEWKNFPGFTTLQILAEIQKKMTEIQCEPVQFIGQMIFMSMYNDIVW